MSELDKARNTLLCALEQLESAQEELGGEAERADLVVVYDIGRAEGGAWHNVGGWASTSGPKYVHAALLRRAANWHEEAPSGEEDEE